MAGKKQLGLSSVSDALTGAVGAVQRVDSDGCARHALETGQWNHLTLVTRRKLSDSASGRARIRDALRRVVVTVSAGPREACRPAPLTAGLARDVFRTREQLIVKK